MNPLVRRIVEALPRAIDAEALERELSDFVAPAAAAGPVGPARPDLVARLTLADILDEAILGARAGDKPYPLRLLFARIGDELATSDAAFELASALNVYFRVRMEEEVKMRLGLEVSRLFYAFTADAASAERAALAPLLATLMTGELPRLRFESVDHVRVFDSGVHEREPGSDTGSAPVRRPATFLVRVAATGMVRARASVIT
jgi:hypothetical protein